MGQLLALRVLTPSRKVNAIRGCYRNQRQKSARIGLPKAHQPGYLMREHC